MPASAHKPEAQAMGPAVDSLELNPAAITAALKSAARRLGFTLAGTCPAVAPTGVSRLAEWLDRGYAGQMHYIAARQEAYSHPRHILDGCRSILMLGLPYGSHLKSKIQNLKSSGFGRISSYACLPADYHDTIHDKLKQLIAHLRDLAPHATARGVVDTAPLLEREFAQLSGLGWIGKHTLLIHRETSGANALRGVPLCEGEPPAGPNPISKIQNLKSAAPALPTNPIHSSGSYFFLAALLTDLELTYDDPFTTDHCGACRACLDACPTQAFPQPYVLDATRCISYLTIELKGHIPRDLRAPIGDWLFGCDVCQDVCPWNQHAVRIDERCRERPLGCSATPPDNAADPGTIGDANPKSKIQNPKSDLASRIDLIALFSLDDDSFRHRFRHTPLWRARRRGILRNAAIVLGNQFRAATQARSASEVPGREFIHPSDDRLSAAISALTRGLHDPEPLIRAASAWALGQIGCPEAHEAITARQQIETDPVVLQELNLP